KYGGVLCGAPGNGYISDYLIDFLGDKLYESLGHIKKAFDPYNQLNTGKITVPNGSSDKLEQVDGPVRGYVDEQVPNP
ncbi:hypothetical protein NAI48_13095, partial [Francisella tularensis subsp. holarctica]|uniref:FAD-linked oxidase C-terminal domain-containing protein n=1 Tax=Francisella tularensis TaxID=263 RepID=UPI002381B39B